MINVMINYYQLAYALTLSVIGKSRCLFVAMTILYSVTMHNRGHRHRVIKVGDLGHTFKPENFSRSRRAYTLHPEP